MLSLRTHKQKEYHAVSGTLALYHELKDKQQLLVQQQKQREIMIKICIVYAVREIRVCLAKDAVLLVISESESKITRDAREMQCI